ncbi:MAG: class I SAM-dependent methyltransferase [Clostridiales bacterium]|nr:class I SAM-dependent methyltransferase [Clostridiales bacterium]
MPQYFESVPTTASDRKTFKYTGLNRNLMFTTDTSVFSRNGVDFGTDLLIEESVKDIKERGVKPMHMLDLGCGVGIVGVTFKSYFARCEVYGTDVNTRAVALAEENAVNNNVDCKFISGDVTSSLPEGLLFDTILTNPPVRAGKKTVFRFYEESFERLEKGGSLYVVLQRKQGAPSTKAKLTELFGNCTNVATDGGYHIMRADKT